MRYNQLSTKGKSRMFKSLTLIMLLLSTGCAFTVHDVNVDYKYSKPIEFSFLPQPISVTDIKDARGLETPRMIMNMTNLNGQTTSGGWQAEKALSEIVKDAIVQGLEKTKSYSDGDTSKFIMSGELLSFDVKTIMGAWQGSYKGKMSAKFQLVDKESGKIVWRDNFVGSSEVKGNEGVVGVLKITLDDLVSKLFNDEYFQQKISAE
jgi:hypothetical protein